MKGLTLTLTIVIVAIVLLVTALVIMTIFGGSIAEFVGILNPWSEEILRQNLCNQKCAAWCQGHLGRDGEDWTQLSVKTQSGEISCSTVMDKISDRCNCRGIPISGGCKVTCDPGDAGQEKRAQSTCGSGKECKVNCPSGLTNAREVTGTCVTRS